MKEFMKSRAWVDFYHTFATVLSGYFFLGGPVVIFLCSLPFLSYTWRDFWIWFCFHFIMVTGIGVSYHRYFSHKSFEVNRWGQFFVGFWGSLSLQRGPLWWASVHRFHHRFCGTPKDPHNPAKGKYYSHFKWTTLPENQKVRWEYVGDLAKFPELRWLEYAYLLNWPLLSVLLYWMGGLPAVIVYHVAISTSFNVISSVNSLCHDPSEHSCAAKNVAWITLLAAGEGLHLNHHDHPGSASCSAKWYQIDLSFLLIRFLKLLGIVKRIHVEKNWSKPEETHSPEYTETT